MIVHDPQPAGIPAALDGAVGSRAKWIWHCHLDLTGAPDAVRMLLRSACDSYDALVFDLPQYAIPEIAAGRPRIIRPAIDPLDGHNADLSESSVADILLRLGVDPGRPLIVQVAPLDRWHDGIGLIDVVREVRRAVPDVQLVLVANIVRDDPEARGYFQQICQHIQPDEPVRVISTLRELGYVGINVFQRAASAVALRNVRKGLSMRLLDAMWKERAVVTRPSEALKEVVQESQTAWLPETDEQWAKALVHALTDVEEARRRGVNAQAFVRDNYLVTRFLADYLALFQELR